MWMSWFTGGPRRSYKVWSTNIRGHQIQSSTKERCEFWISFEFLNLYLCFCDLVILSAHSKCGRCSNFLMITSTLLQNYLVVAYDSRSTNIFCEIMRYVLQKVRNSHPKFYLSKQLRPLLRTLIFLNWAVAAFSQEIIPERTRAFHISDATSKFLFFSGVLSLDWRSYSGLQDIILCPINIRILGRSCTGHWPVSSCMRSNTNPSLRSSTHTLFRFTVDRLNYSIVSSLLIVLVVHMLACRRLGPPTGLGLYIDATWTCTGSESIFS